MSKETEQKMRIEVNNSETFDSEEDYEAVAAITAAATLLFGSVGSSDKLTQVRQKQSTWKFSGYWWARPVPMVRARPF